MHQMRSGESRREALAATGAAPGLPARSFVVAPEIVEKRSPGPPMVVALAFGVASVAEEGLRAAGGLAGRAAGRAASVGVPLWRVVPTPLRAALEARVEDLKARGRDQEAATRQALLGLVGQGFATVMSDSRLLGLIDDLVRREIEPGIDAALPIVLDRLEADPEPVRAMVRDQSVGVAAELADDVRTRSAAADDKLEQIARRLFLRRRRPLNAEPAPGSKSTAGSGPVAGPAAGPDGGPVAGPDGLTTV